MLKPNNPSLSPSRRIFSNRKTLLPHLSCAMWFQARYIDTSLDSLHKKGGSQRVWREQCFTPEFKVRYLWMIHVLVPLAAGYFSMISNVDSSVFLAVTNEWRSELRDLNFAHINGADSVTLQFFSDLGQNLFRQELQTRKRCSWKTCGIVKHRTQIYRLICKDCSFVRSLILSKTPPILTWDRHFGLRAMLEVTAAVYPKAIACYYLSKFAIRLIFCKLTNRENSKESE